MDNIQTAKILRKAAALCARGWTQGEYARMKNGVPCAWDDKRAVKWCVLGAIWRAGHDLGALLHVDKPLEILEQVTGTAIHEEWNDARYRTKKQVVCALRKAAIRVAREGL